MVENNLENQSLDTTFEKCSYFWPVWFTGSPDPSEKIIFEVSLCDLTNLALHTWRATTEIFLESKTLKSSWGRRQLVTFGLYAVWQRICSSIRSRVDLDDKSLLTGWKLRCYLCIVICKHKTGLKLVQSIVLSRSKNERTTCIQRDTKICFVNFV